MGVENSTKYEKHAITLNRTRRRLEETWKFNCINHKSILEIKCNLQPLSVAKLGMQSYNLQAKHNKEYLSLTLSKLELKLNLGTKEMGKQK